MIATKSNPLRPHLAAPRRWDGVDSTLREFAAAHSALILRASLAFVFCAFGVLKLYPGLSPAERLAGDTLRLLSGGLVQPNLGVPLLGVFEVTLGLAVLLRPHSRLTVPALLTHLAGTATPLLLFPHAMFSTFPAPTLLGQYILKNVVLAAAALAVLGSGNSAS